MTDKTHMSHDDETQRYYQRYQHYTYCRRKSDISIIEIAEYSCKANKNRNYIKEIHILFLIAEQQTYLQYIIVVSPLHIFQFYYSTIKYILTLTTVPML